MLSVSKLGCCIEECNRGPQSPFANPKNRTYLGYTLKWVHIVFYPYEKYIVIIFLSHTIVIS